MDIFDAAQFFDQNPCFDAYTGVELFQAQLDLYDGTERDSLNATRRVLSAAPDIVPPARRVIRLENHRYILGRSNMDVFQGQAIRQGWVCHEATALAQILTLGQACLGTPGTQVWAGDAWIRNAAFTEQSSVLTPNYFVYMAYPETVAVNNVISFNGRLLIVRAEERSTADFLVVQVEDIAAPALEPVTVRSGYDRTLRTMNPLSSPETALRLRWQSLYQYHHETATPFGPNEAQFAFAQSALMPAVGDEVLASDGTWKMTSVDLVGDAWICRVMKHG